VATQKYGGSGGHATRRYLSADADVTVDDEAVTVDVGDVKIGTSAKPRPRITTPIHVATCAQRRSRRL